MCFGTSSRSIREFRCVSKDFAFFEVVLIKNLRERKTVLQKSKNKRDAKPNFPPASWSRCSLSAKRRGLLGFRHLISSNFSEHLGLQGRPCILSEIREKPLSRGNQTD